jgi:hypothetical protein
VIKFDPLKRGRTYAGWLFAALLLSAAPLPARAFLDGWTLEVKSGDAASAPLPVKFVQNGYSDVNFDADWRDRPLLPPYYYSYRIGHWKDGAAWEFETLHHKLFLSNAQQDIQDYAVTHGYNEWTVNRAWLLGGPLSGFIGRVGLGIVVAHPGGEIHGLFLDEDHGIDDGFYVAGPASQIALEKRFHLIKGLFFSAEAKVTLAYARIPTYDIGLSGEQGHVDLPNLAVHGLLGLGYQF